MADFWVVAPCSLAELTNVSEVLAAIIALMMEATRTSETLVNFYNPEDSHLRNHRRGNLKSYYNFPALLLSREYLLPFQTQLIRNK
jgi:hypothetical protein